MSEQEQAEKFTPQRRVGIREFRQNLTGLLRQVREGRSLLITSHNQVVAEVRPPSRADRSPRSPGALGGMIWLAEDFDELPPDVGSRG